MDTQDLSDFIESTEIRDSIYDYENDITEKSVIVPSIGFNDFFITMNLSLSQEENSIAMNIDIQHEESEVINASQKQKSAELVDNYIRKQGFYKTLSESGFNIDKIEYNITVNGH